MKKKYKRILSSIGVFSISFGTIAATVSANTSASQKYSEKVPFTQNGLVVFGFNGRGYINLSQEKLQENNIENFSYQIFGKNNIKKVNYEIANGDTIRYSFRYKNVNYNKTYYVTNLKKSHVPQILKVHKKYIYEAIKKGNFLTKWRYFSVRKLKSLDDQKTIIYKITANKNIKKYDIKRGQAFYMVTRKYKKAVQMGRIIKTKNYPSTFGKGHAHPSFWNYNDDGSYEVKLYVNLDLKEGESFKIDKIINAMVVDGKRTHKIDKIETKTNVKALFQKRIVSRKVDEEKLDIPQVEKVWFDKSGSFTAGTFFEGFFGGIGAAISAPFNIVAGLALVTFTHDLDYLYLSIDDSSQNTSNLDEGISSSKLETYKWTSIGVSIAALPFGGKGALALKLAKKAKLIKVGMSINKASLISKMPKTILWITKNLYKVARLTKNIKSIIKKVNTDLNINEKTLDSMNDSQIKNLFARIGKNVLKKIGKNNFNDLLRSINEKKAYDEISSVASKLSKKGLVVPTQSKIRKTYYMNDPILYETITVKFNAKSKSFWSTTHVTLTFDQNKSAVVFLGEKEVLSEMDLASILNINNGFKLLEFQNNFN